MVPNITDAHHQLQTPTRLFYLKEAEIKQSSSVVGRTLYLFPVSLFCGCRAVFPDVSSLNYNLLRYVFVYLLEKRELLFHLDLKQSQRCHSCLSGVVYFSFFHHYDNPEAPSPFKV